MSTSCILPSTVSVRPYNGYFVNVKSQVYRFIIYNKLQWYNYTAIDQCLICRVAYFGLLRGIKQ